MTLEDINAHFEIESESGEKALASRLLAMLKSGELVCADEFYAINRDCRVWSVNACAAYQGGELVLQCSDGEIAAASPRMEKHLFANDQLRLRMVCKSGKQSSQSAQIASAQVVERKKELVGTFDPHKMCIIPLQGLLKFGDPVRIDKKSAEGVADGATVLVRLAPPAFLGESLRGHIIEVREYQNDGQMEIDKAVCRFGIPHYWEEAVTSEAERAAKQVPIGVTEGRRDMRDKCFVTIDGADAKDFDDAILVEKLDDGMRLSVAIADVSSYVAPGSALDEEAYERGNSVYFPQKVVPMLPHILSDDVCSLRPDQDRLALVCAMRISSQGVLEEYDFYPAVICSKARLTYTEVSGFLTENKALQNPTEGVASMLRLAYRLWELLDAQRQKRGAVELDIAATTVVFNPGKPLPSLVLFKRNDAHRLIEEFMICANVSAAKFLADHKIPYMRRVHQGLKPNSVDRLNALLAPMKLKLQKESIDDVQGLLAQAQGHPQKELIHRAILQSFARAAYAPLDTGHFGLALNDYAHFTSPIRRYADLLVHRAIYQALGFDLGSTVSEESLTTMGAHCSETEKTADGATRDIEQYFKCKIIEPHVGETFDGIVAAVTSFGLFVEIPQYWTDGLIHISKLGEDYYTFDAATQTLRGERSGERYYFGQEIKVKLMRSDAGKREIDFLPANRKQRKQRRRR